MAEKRTLDLSTIVEVLSAHRREFQENYGVRELGIFGSYARGEAGKRSDIDILVAFDDHARVSLLDFLRLEHAIEDLLGVRVDLVEKSTLKPRIGKHILREARYVWRGSEK